MQTINCFACNTPGATKRCSVCKAAWYCDTDCQKQHWIEHKRKCTVAFCGPPTVEEVEAKRVRFIEQQSVTSPIILEVPWAFLARLSLCVNGKQEYRALLGDMSYAYSHYEFGPAIKIRDWVFVLERMTEAARLVINPVAEASTWYVCGFRQRKHYNFGKVTDGSNLQRTFLDFVIPRFWPILHPEAFVGCAPDADGQVKFSWTTGPLLPGEENKLYC